MGRAPAGGPAGSSSLSPLLLADPSGAVSGPGRPRRGARPCAPRPPTCRSVRGCEWSREAERWERVRGKWAGGEGPMG